MCGRYFIDDAETTAEMRKIFNEINQRYHNTNLSVVLKTGEIFPTDRAPVLINEQKNVQPVLMTWGYPTWHGSGVVINARAETAEEKPMFRASIPQRRCIIPSSGFFEWSHSKDQPKTKFLLKQNSSEMLYMAGLYSIFTDQDGKKHAAYAILTANANASVSPIHDRMPLIVAPDLHERWLQDEEYARSMLSAPCLAEMTAMQV